MSIDLTSFDIEKAKAEIKLLVEKFEREKNNNRLESYTEEQTPANLTEVVRHWFLMSKIQRVLWI